LEMCQIFRIIAVDVLIVGYLLFFNIPVPTQSTRKMPFLWFSYCLWLSMDVAWLLHGYFGIE